MTFTACSSTIDRATPVQALQLWLRFWLISTIKESAIRVFARIDFSELECEGICNSLGALMVKRKSSTLSYNGRRTWRYAQGHLQTSILIQETAVVYCTRRKWWHMAVTEILNDDRKFKSSPSTPGEKKPLLRRTYVALQAVTMSAYNLCLRSLGLHQS